MKFPIFTVISIMMVGIFFFIYIMFNYGFHNPLNGAFTILDQQRDTMMDPNYSSWARDLLDFNHNWWGTGFCVLIVNVLLCGFIDAVRKPSESV